MYSERVKDEVEVFNLGVLMDVALVWEEKIHSVLKP